MAVPRVPVVARVGNDEISHADLRSAANALSPLMQRELRTKLGTRAFVDALVDSRAMVAEARRRELHQRPSLRRRLRLAEEQILVAALVDDELSQTDDATKLREHFRDHADEFARPEAARAQRVRVGGKHTAGADSKALRHRAEQLRSEIERSGSPPAAPSEGHGGELEGDHTVDALTWLTRADVPDPVLREAVFGPSPRSVPYATAVHESDDGFTFYYVTRRRARRLPSYEEAIADVRAATYAERHRSAYRALAAQSRSRVDVHIDLSAVELD